MKRNPSAYGERCGAKTRGGSPCKNAAMPNGRCRMHGGKSLRGVAHPNFSHGRYSRDILAGMVDGYLESLRDSKLLMLNDEIALSVTYLKQTLRDGESLVRWHDVVGAWKEHQEALAAGEARAVTRSIENMDEIVHRGLHDYSHQAEVMQRLEAKRKLVEAEHKHRVDGRMALTHEQALAQVAALVDILRKRITDRDLLRVITDDIREIARGIDNGRPGDADRN